MSTRDRLSTNIHTHSTSGAQGESRSTVGQTATEPRLSPGPVDSALAPLGQNAHALAMSNIDGCPECVRNTEPPKSAVRVERAWRCAYLCSSCGHAWATDWRD